MPDFPDDCLALEVEAAFGADLTTAPSTWVFTDLSDRLLPEPITIRRGVAAGAATGQTSLGTVQLRNDDGWLTPKLASSPWWPYVDVGTPARVRLRVNRFAITDTFTRTVSNGWGTANTGQAWTPISPAAQFAVTGSAGTMSAVTHGVGVRIMGAGQLRDYEMLFDCSVPAVATGVANIVGPVGRYSSGGDYVWATVEFGLAGVLQIKARAVHDGISTDLSQITVPGLTYSAGTVIRARVQIVGTRIRMRAWLPAGTEPATWLLDISNPYVAAAGGWGMRALNFVGNTNTLPLAFTVDNITVTEAPQDRIEGYLADVRPVFLPEGGGVTWSEVAIDIAGVGSRLENNDSPAWSPMRRSVQLAAVPPIAYWPLEDGEGASFGAPAFPGQQKMLVTGPAVFGYAAGVPAEQYLTRYGTKPMVSVAPGARLSATVPASVTSQWAVDVTAQLYVPEVPGVTEIRIAEWVTTGGTYDRWALVGTTTGYQVRAYNDTAGTVTNVVVDTFGVYDIQITFEIDAVQNGANIDVAIYYNSGAGDTGSIAGTVGAVSKLTLNPDRANTTASVTPRGLRFIVGHARVSDDASGTGIPFYYDVDQNSLLLRADQAWYQEAAHRRVRRLCDEQGIPCEILGQPYTTGITKLGAQQDGTFTELLAAAVNAESGGLLYEAGFGYRYLPRTARYNQPVSLVIDLNSYAHTDDTDAAAVLVPRLDPRRANYWTIERTGGASGSYAADAAFRRRRGTIPQQATLDLLRDEDTDDHAAWRVHVDVDVDARDADYPDLTIDLAANPDLIDTWLACDIGSRVHRTNQPALAGAGIIDQVIEGITEQLGPDTWLVTANATPAAVWDVAVIGDPVLGWAGTADTSLHTAVSATVTTLVVDVPGATWTTDPAGYPVDVSLGGERITLNNPPSGSTTPQTFPGCTRSVNGVAKTHAVGEQVALWTTPFLAL